MSRTAKTESVTADQLKPEPTVLRKHVEILREIKAPEKVIQLAERVAAASASKE